MPRQTRGSRSVEENDMIARCQLSTESRERPTLKVRPLPIVEWVPRPPLVPIRQASTNSNRAFRQVNRRRKRPNRPNCPPRLDDRKLGYGDGAADVDPFENA